MYQPDHSNFDETGSVYGPSTLHLVVSGCGGSHTWKRGWLLAIDHRVRHQGCRLSSCPTVHGLSSRTRFGAPSIPPQGRQSVDHWPRALAQRHASNVQHLASCRPVHCAATGPLHPIHKRSCVGGSGEQAEDNARPAVTCRLCSRKRTSSGHACDHRRGWVQDVRVVRL